jgi:sugar phosphate permease
MAAQDISQLKLPEEHATVSATRPTRVRYQVLAAGCSVAVVAYIHRVGFATATTEIKSELCLSSQDIGFLMTAFLLAYGGFEVPGGLLSDRFGVRHLLTILVLGWSLTTGGISLVALLPGLMAAFYVLWILRFLFGMFQAGGFPALSRMMTDWMTRQERASAQGLIWMSSRLGGALIPLLLGGLFVWVGWKSALWIVTEIGLAWCVVFWLWFRNRPEEMSQVNALEREIIVAGRGQVFHGHLGWSTLFRSRSVWGLCLMYGFGGFAATFFVTMLPDYLQNHRQLSPGQTKWLTSLPLACGILACALGGFLSDWFIRRSGNRKWGRRLNGGVGLTLAGLAIFSTIWVHNVYLLGVLLCFTFFCNDINMGPAWAACADVGERYAGTVGGAMNMLGNLAAAGMTTIAGILLVKEKIHFAGFEFPGRDLLFAIFGLFFILAALCWLLVDVTQPLVKSTAFPDSQPESGS